MNAADETELTPVFTEAVEALTPDAAARILEHCEEFTASIKQDEMFGKLAENRPLFQLLINTQTSAFEQLRKSDLPDSSQMEPNAVRWIQLLAAIAPFNDFNAMAMQFALFVIAQERGVFAIEDPSARLFACYLHVRIACHTLLIEAAVNGRN
jgi:hypothetical protein